MTVRGLRYWEPQLDLRVTRGIPDQVQVGFRDRVLSFELEEDFFKMDYARIALDNSDGKIFDVTSLPLGIFLKTSFGYPGAMSRPLELECRKITGAVLPGTGGRGGLGFLSGPNTAAGGVLSMELFSRLWSFNEKRIERVGTGTADPGRQLVFKAKTVPEIVREIARRNGFPNSKIFIDELDEEGKIDQVIPNLMSDYEYLQHLAARRGWVMRINPDGFYMLRVGDTDRDIEDRVALSWFAGAPDVIEWSFGIDLNVENLIKVKEQQNERTATEIKDLSDEAEKARAPQSEEGTDVLSLGIPVVIETNVNYESHQRKRFRTLEEIERKFSSLLRRRFLKMRLVGNPRVHPGTVLDLTNFGPLMDGPWWCWQANHSIRPGQVYITEVKASRRRPERRKRKGILSRTATDVDGIPVLFDFTSPLPGFRQAENLEDQ